MSIRANLRAYLHLTGANLRAFSRDRAALVWSFLLPLLLVLVFGSLFGKMGREEPARFPIGLVFSGERVGAEMTYTADAFRRIPYFETHIGPLPQEKEALLRGDRHALVVFPPDFAVRLMQGRTTPVRVLYDPTQPEPITQPVRNALRQAIAAMDRQITNTPSLLEAREETVDRTGGERSEEIRPLDFVLPGLFAVTMMQLGLFTAIPLITLRERGVLKRLRATPIPAGTVVAAQVTQRLIVGVVQATLILLLGRAVFGFRMACSPLDVLPVLLFGLLIFIAIGAVLASVARTQDAGMSLVQVINLPLMLLSGLLLPLEMLPDVVRPIAAILPTTYLGDILRQMMLNAGGLHPLPTDFAVLGVYLVLALVVAVRTFRWE
ncbi:MAG: ABC transporter permease [Capsulimonadales bacterium]|nr:ABC transporter permease [Capsulimonadales bacterium]